MLHTDSKLLASYDPEKHEYFERGVMYRVKKKWKMYEKWRVGREQERKCKG